jgi:hypothetical protein
MFQRSKKLGLCLSLILAFCLSGCAFKRIIYDQLDWVVMYQIDSYLDLSKEQKIKFKPVVSEAVTYLKREKIPAAIEVIEKLEAAAAAHRYDDSMNKLLTNEVDKIRHDLLGKYEAPIIELLLSLSQDQVEYLAKKVEKSNKEMKNVLKEKDMSDYDDVIKKQEKSVVEWYGDLEKSQSEFFYQTMRLTRPQLEKRLAERERIQAYMIETLKSHDANRIKTMVESFRDQGEVWQDPVYIQYRNAAEERWEVYLKALHSSLTNKQWAHLEEKLKDFKQDLGRMIGRE